jgi:hypothetical protein
MRQRPWSPSKARCSSSTAAGVPSRSRRRMSSMGFLAIGNRRQVHGRERPPVRSELGYLPRNHAPQIAAMDLFVVPTVSFNLLYVLVIVRLARRELVWINVTAHATPEWIAQQITEAFPWNEAPRYLIRDRDGI